jgi:VanZ family protein
MIRQIAGGGPDNREVDSNVVIQAAPAGERIWLKWIPVALWAVILFILSTSFFSATQTSRIIEPILRFILPGASSATISLLHALVRKAAHFTNYGILFWLLIRGPMVGRPYAALAFCVCYALLDEGHQIFAVGRTPSLYDVALDSSGALFSRFLHAASSELV